jgi:uncharacterized protein YndB with AHSA1/START domain
MGGRFTYTDSPTFWPRRYSPTDKPIQTEKEASCMAPIVTSIEIDRPQDDVFAYVTDPTRFAEWQAGVEGGSTEGGTSPHVGAKCTTTRRVGGTARQVTSEITKIDPPTSWGIHGIDGPIRAIVDVTVEPLNGSAQSRVTIELD